MAQSPQRKLVLGIPKGSLQESTLDLFVRAGYNVSVPSRSYAMSFDDEELTGTMFRAQEMSRYVEDGVLDAGITGRDWIEENGSDVVEVAELVYAKQRLGTVRWVLAVPEESEVRRVEDLKDGIVATELVNCTRRFFADRKVDVKVEFSYGATEAKARLVDGIVDVTETGSSLQANGLRIVEEVLTSSTRLIANKAAMAVDWKRQKIENIALLLKGAIAGRQKVGLKMNVAEEKVERDLIPQLKRAGATGIFTYPLNKVIP
jgi:ATP phosphoribosyltransferase